MDSEIINSDSEEASKIFFTLYDEYMETNIDGWSNFINSKNLGIICDRVVCVYKIIDEKKWMLTKLKYGF